MKTEEEKLEDLVSTKLFTNLSAEEKQFVLDALGSEEQFNTLQRIHATLLDHPVVASVRPAPHVLIALKHKLRETKKGPLLLPVILQFKIPAYAALILAVIVGSLTAMVSNGSSVKQPLVIVPKMERDTVYITNTDTVYRERLLIKYVRVSTPAEPEIVTASSKSDRILGVSMKDKEELDRLLVSGLN
ncbi:MAG TPA: hypothetical protein VK517_16180 [Cyclobacteriaceae bacterium]|nr:hypothetical protein [Cyclobacteriaceae bacterium]